MIGLSGGPSARKIIVLSNHFGELGISDKLETQLVIILPDPSSRVGAQSMMVDRERRCWSANYILSGVSTARS
jgi:hypothetical protein